MAWDVMVLCGQYPLQGPLEGLGPEIETFLGPEMATSEASANWVHKSTKYGYFSGTENEIIKKL
jgi:hypothetical protein